MSERITGSVIKAPLEYYSNTAVSKTIFEYLGCDSPDAISLTDTSQQNAVEIQNQIDSEYLAVSNLEIKNQKKGRAPARTIKPRQLPEVIISQPLTEIHQSLWQVNVPNSEGMPYDQIKPTRSLMVIDIEHYHHTYPGIAIADQLGVFELLEPAYDTFKNKFRQYGINCTSVMTGRGYHFITQVPGTSDVMNKLIEVGSRVENSVKESQRVIPPGTKRDRSVPLMAQQAHKGIALLSHYLVCQSIRSVRQIANIPVEVSDIGEEGIALDLTPFLVRSVHNGEIGTMGSIYVKPLIKSEHFGKDLVEGSRLLTRIPRSVQFRETRPLTQLLNTRRSFGKTAELLQETGGKIPDGSAGIDLLISDYLHSNLYKLHKALDEEPGDPPEKWNDTYRNYGGIAGNDGYMLNAFNNANDLMLNPNVLNIVLNRLFDKWGGASDISVAGHVRTFLRSVYEDPRFNWGKRFTRHYSAEQHATGWANIILGQRFEDD